VEGAIPPAVVVQIERLLAYRTGWCFASIHFDFMFYAFISKKLTVG
jgi:hypothetical protein